jgi:peptidyl-prolyl cis-trans isomerase SurA
MNFKKAFYPLLICSAFAQNPVILDQKVANIGKHILLLSDLEDFQKTLSLRRSLDPLIGLSPLAEYSQPKDIPLDKIIDYLIEEFVIYNQFTPSEMETENEITRMLSNARTNRKELEAFLKSQNFIFEDYKNIIKTSIAKKNLIERELRSRIYVSEEELKNELFNHSRKQGREVQAYELKMIAITPSKSKAQAKERIEKAYRILKNTQHAFEAIAKEYSNAHSASSGGDLGFLTPEQTRPSFQKQLASLQIGQISPVFEDEGTFYIIKLCDIQTQKNQNEEEKEILRIKLIEKKTQYQIELWLQKAKGTLFINKSLVSKKGSS